MKNHLLSIVFFTVLFLSCLSAMAQPAIVKKPGINLGANLVYSMPNGEFRERFSYGLGGEIYGGIGWGSTYLIVTTGFSRFQNKPGVSDAITTVPLKVGFKKYFLLKRLFVNGDMGSTSVKMKGSGARGFTIGVGGGVRFLGVEASLYYNAFRNALPEMPNGYSNSLNARIGWNFTL